MKKFSQAITAIHEAETAVKSDLQKSYAEYFKAKLNKFDAKSPADLSPEQKTEFFNEITKDWDKGVGAKPAGKKDVEEHGVKESEVNEGMISPQMANGFKIGDKIKTQKGTYTITGFGSRTGATRDFEAENEKGEQFNLRVSLRGATGIQVAAGKSLNFPEQEEMLESEEVNEAEVKSDADFKEYAEKVLKKAHGDKYDEEKATKTIEGILKKADGDYGAAVGIINSSLGESEEIVEGSAAHCDSCDRPATDCVCDKSNESIDTLNEGATTYISDPKFKDDASLKSDILKNAGPALNDLLSRQGIKYNPLNASDRGGSRISFESKPITGKDLGFMQYGFKEVYINIFSGGNYPQVNKAAGENFEFSPYIWATLNYSYQHTLGGSNGCGLLFPGEQGDSIYYDVVAGKWLTNTEAGKRSDWK